MSDENEKPASPSMVSITVTDVLGIGKASETLAPAGQKIAEAVGRLIEPVLSAAKIYLDARAEGAALRHETKANLKHVTEIERILADNPELAEQMKNRLVSTEMRRQANLHTATTKALELTTHLPSDAEVHDVDPDFVQEWIEGVKDVANEHVQDLWAAILASAPLKKEGRISKPALSLLQQVDQPTAAMFAEYVKIWWSVGVPSAKVPDMWAPFGKSVDFKLLEEMGFIKRVTYSGMKVSDLGFVMQVSEKFSGFTPLNTLEVFAPSNRALELVKAVFVSPISVPDEVLLAPRKEYMSWLANDSHFSLVIAADHEAFEQGHFRFKIRALGTSEEPVDTALSALASDSTLTSIWSEVLKTYAETGRLHINEPQ